MAPIRQFFMKFGEGGGTSTNICLQNPDLSKIRQQYQARLHEDLNTFTLLKAATNEATEQRKGKQFLPVHGNNRHFYPVVRSTTIKIECIVAFVWQQWSRVHIHLKPL